MASRVDREYSSSKDNYKKRSSGNIRKQPSTKLQYNPWEFEQPWSHDFCNITEECDETCYAIWCFPCFSCHLAWHMNESCWITCCLPGHLAVLRTKMRTTFRINGSYCCDFCLAECCPVCAAVQMASELRFRKVPH